jgi:hypothetical protein
MKDTSALKIRALYGAVGGRLFAFTYRPAPPLRGGSLCERFFRESPGKH